MIEQYISDLKKLPEPKKTILEILKVHKKEVPLSNLLAYFFRNKESHDLKNLFIEALLLTKYSELKKGKKSKSPNLLSLFRLENTDFKKLEVKTEYPSKKEKPKGLLFKKRIDLLIESEQFVICIEFKMNHDLDNPLQAYKNYLDSVYGDKKKIFIVLTPYKKEAIGNAKKFSDRNNDFKVVIFRDFINNIKKSLPNNNNNPYLAEFIQTIENREILYKRSYLLNDLLTELNEYTFYNNNKFSFHKNNKGGFIELKEKNDCIKVRIENKQWRVEYWKNNKKEESKLVQLEAFILENLLISIIAEEYKKMKVSLIKKKDVFHKNILKSHHLVSYNSKDNETNRMDKIFNNLLDRIVHEVSDLSKIKTIYLKISTGVDKLTITEIGQIRDWIHNNFPSKCDLSFEAIDNLAHDEFNIKMILTNHKYYFLDVVHDKIFIS